MNALQLIILVICAGVVLVRCICVAAQLNYRNWLGHPFQFVGISASYALLGGGAIGTVLEWDHSSLLLLLGVSSWIIFDRRRFTC